MANFVQDEKRRGLFGVEDRMRRTKSIAWSEFESEFGVIDFKFSDEIV